MEDLALFDVEYIFLQLRGRSVQETIEIEVPCDDDPEVKVPVTFPVDDVKVVFLRVMRVVYDRRHCCCHEVSNLDYFAKVNIMEEEPDPYGLVSACIDRVFANGEDCGDFTPEEAKEWLETLTNEQFEKVQNFFDTMPKLGHTITVKNPKTKVETTTVIEGLINFSDKLFQEGLERFYTTNFALVQHHKYTLTDIENDPLGEGHLRELAC